MDDTQAHGDLQRSTAEPASREIERQVQKRIFKIVVIGDSNVGKTCLTFRFCGKKFPDKTEATIGVDFREKTVQIGDEAVKLQLWDTAGQERFRKSMVQHYYRNVHAIIYVYDVTRLSSFENLPLWISECNHHNLSVNVPRIMVGNKCDLREKVAVNTNMAQQFADMHSMPLFETSAKDNSMSDHVEAIFLTIAHKLITEKPMMLPLTSSGSSDEKMYSIRSKVDLGEQKSCAC